MKNIVVFDSTFYIRNRIKELTNLLDVKIIEAETSRQLMNALNTKDNMDLIIMEISLPHEDGIGILRKIRSLYSDIPIIILTSKSKRSSFVEGIQQGASDYILKPFDDEFLVERISQHLERKRTIVSNKNDSNKKQGLSVDFQNYLDKELKKAVKRDYELTILITLYFKADQEMTSRVEKEYHRVSDILFPKLLKVVFDTDVFMKYGSQSFIGVFPFCSKENQHLIDEKFQAEFEKLQMEYPLLGNYCIFNTFVTFPYDGDTRDVIMNKLVSKIYEDIDKQKIKYLPKEL